MANGRFIDLNSKFIETQGSPPLCKEPSDEFWQNDFRATDGLHTFRLPISLLRGALRRPLQGQKFFMLGSVSDSGFYSTHLSRESQRHRNVPAYHTAKTYHMGIRSTVSRNTLANANQVRDWRIYADFAQTLIQEARTLYKGEPSNSTTPCMPWTPPPSICVCRFSLVHSFAHASPQSNCTRCSICAAVFPRW